jgi:hypothetical protein
MVADIASAAKAEVRHIAAMGVTGSGTCYAAAFTQRH